MIPLALWIGLALADAPTYAGRPIAPFMSAEGAGWLERAERAAEEGTLRLLRQLRLRSHHTVVDLGCGTGFHARRMARKVDTVFCVDLQPDMLARAAQLAAREGVALQLVQGSHDRIPLADDSADLVLLVDVYHELQEPRQMHAELLRVLRPGGTLAVVEFRLEGTTAAHIRSAHRMDAGQVERELTAAGFRLVERFDALPSQHLLRFAAP